MIPISWEKLQKFKFKTNKNSSKGDGSSALLDCNFTKKITKIQNKEKIVKRWRFCTALLLSTSISRENYKNSKQIKIRQKLRFCTAQLLSTKISRENYETSKQTRLPLNALIFSRIHLTGVLAVQNLTGFVDSQIFSFEFDGNP